MSRVFYHSITGEQFKPSDCLEDSEEELDNTWIQEMEEKLIDEPSNVNLLDKLFMKLWNTLTNSILRVSNIICIKFIENYLDQLHEMRD